MPSATPDQLATAIEDVVQAGEKVINLSAALVESTSVGLHRLEQALDFSASRNAIVVAAAGNRSQSAALGSGDRSAAVCIIPANRT